MPMTDTPGHSLLLIAPRRLAWTEQVLPPPAGRDVLVETRAGAISIGSELPVYLARARGATPAAYPRMTGYESLGTVVACGPAVRHLQPGDRVVGFYGHRTHAVVAEDQVLAVPPGVGDKDALLVILTCDVAKGIGKVRPWLSEPALVTGAGAIGLLTVWMLRALGATAIDVVEPDATRRALARRLGARQAYDPQEVDAAGDTYAVAFECSSRDSAFALLQDRLQHGGRLCILADGNIEPLTLAPAFHAKELTVVGTSDGWDYHAHAAWYFDALRHDRHDLAQVFDLEVPADDLPATFERLAADRRAAIKVLVRY